MRVRILPAAIITAFMALYAVLLPAYAETGKRDLTVMVYMAGSDLESRSGSASRDLKEMMSAVPEGGAVTVVVLTGGSENWACGIAADQNDIWLVRPGALEPVGKTETKNMGAAETLSDFLAQSAGLFPAERYALILWDHGGGPLAGVCFDERYGMDGLTLEELAEALDGSPFADNPLEFIGFDACLMASVETAAAMAPYAKYMIASEEPEPGEGWDYGFLADPSALPDGAEAGRRIIRYYEDSQRENLMPNSLSCIDLSGAEELCREMDSLFSRLAEEMTPDNYPVYAQSRIDSKVVGASSPSDWDLVDLIDLMEKLEKNGGADVAGLTEQAGKMIVCSYASEDREHGLSVYAPFANKQRYTQPWSERYERLGFSEGYRAYVRKFSEIWLAPDRVDWEDKAEIRALQEENRISIVWPLDEALAEDTAYARLLVLENGFGPGNEYRLIYASEPLQPKNGMLRAAYSGEALYLLDRNGEVFCGPIEPKPTGKGVAVPGIMEDALWQMESVYLLWAENGDGTFSLSGIETYNSEMQMYNLSARMPQAGDFFMLGGLARVLPGEDTPYQNWAYGDSILYCSVTYHEGDEWRLQYLPLYSEYSRTALFEITDMQGNSHLSGLIPLDNLGRMELLPDIQVREDAGLQVVLKDAAILTGADPCIQCELGITNTQENARRLYLDSILMDSAALGGTRHCFEWLGYENRPPDLLEPGKEYSARVTIPAGHLGKARIRKFSSMGLVFDTTDSYAAVIFDFPVDAGMIAPDAQDDPIPLFTAEADGMFWEILSMETDEYGNLTGEMHIRNRSGKDRILYGTANVRINGTELIATLERNGQGSVAVPDGYDAWWDYRFYTQTFEDGTRQAVADIRPDGVKEIRLELFRGGGTVEFSADGNK